MFLVALSLLAVTVQAQARPVDGGPVAAELAIVPPRLLSSAEALYPREALERGAEGDVALEVDIDGTGHVVDVRLQRDPGLGMGPAAMDAVRRFTFTPAIIGGEPRAVTIQYTYQFRLQRPPETVDAGAGDATEPIDAGEPDHHAILETTVEAAAPTSAASSATVRDRDLLLRPHATPEDILRVVPGLVIAQHQGGGKADQLFLRGFDADHGTDVALFLDDAPINMPSHGHGQGFADLHFLIPETIERIDVTKGPYYPEYGDFDTAGAVNLRTRKTFNESSLSATYGSFQSYRVLGIASPPLDEGLPWLAASVEGTQGPFIHPEGLERYNIFSKDTLQLNAQTTLALQANLYGSQWSSSGLVPLRAVASDQLFRFGAIDPNEGGQTQRQQLIATLEQRRGTTDAFKLTAWALRYRVRLFSDFTFQARDPEQRLDLIEQNDNRVATGLSVRYSRTAHLAGLRWVTTLGAQARYDDIQTDLWHDGEKREHLGCFGGEMGVPCDAAQVVESSLAAYLEEDLRVSEHLRIVAGVRADLFEFNVEGFSSGLAQRSIVNPKLQVVLRPRPWWDVYVDAGGGFHSNDARAVIASGGGGALPRAWGGELGTRLHLFDRLELAAALWDLRLDSEQVFNADEDSTEAAGPTNRYGADFELRWELRSWLWLDADLALAHAAYLGSTDAVALAPTRTGTAGITAIHPSGLKGRLGVRHVGDRPANADRSLTAEGYTLLDLSLGYRWRFIELGVVLENLTNASWREAQFAYASRLARPPFNEPAPVEDIHFTPGSTFSARATVTLFY